MKPITIPIVFLLFLISIFSYGQDNEKTEKLHRIKVSGHDVFIGNISHQNDSTLTIQVESIGEIKIDKKNILSIKELKRKARSRIISHDFAPGYFLTSSGYGLKEGEIYYQNFWVFFNQVNFGLTDNFSLGIGMMPLFLIDGGPTPVWITPKVSIPIVKDKYNIAAGGLFGTTFGEDANYGVVYFSNTLGSRRNNVSFGMSWGYVEDGYADYPIFNIGFQIKVRPKAYIIADSYISSQRYDGAFVSFGGRSRVGKVFIDYGVLFPTVDETVFVPLLGIKIPL